MFGFWLSLPAWLRLVLALIMLAFGAAVGHWFEWRVGGIFVCLGMAMLFVGGASDSEKKGYRSL